MHSLGLNSWQLIQKVQRCLIMVQTGWHCHPWPNCLYMNVIFKEASIKSSAKFSNKCGIKILPRGMTMAPQEGQATKHWGGWNNMHYHSSNDKLTCISELMFFFQSIINYKHFDFSVLLTKVKLPINPNTCCRCFNIQSLPGKGGIMGFEPLKCSSADSKDTTESRWQEGFLLKMYEKCMSLT